MQSYSFKKDKFNILSNGMQVNNMIYRRTICPAALHGSTKKVYVYITYDSDKERLFISGKVRGRHDQIVDHLSKEYVYPLEEFSDKDIEAIRGLWKRWNLNDCKAGTPRQEELIRQWEKTHTYSYQFACEALKEANLLYDNGHKYGTQWLKEKVPLSVLKYLFSLPSIEGVSWCELSRDIIPIDEDYFERIILN